jgi:hypothetical protein
MTTNTDFRIETQTVGRNGTLKLTAYANDKPVDTDEANISKAVSRTRYVNRLADKLPGIDRALLMQRVEAIANEQATIKADKPESGERKRVIDVAFEELRRHEPTAHRDYRSIWFDRLKREVPIAQLWTLANNEDVDAAKQTIEVIEVSGDRPPTYRTALLNLKDAVAMAAPKLMAELPKISDLDADPTIDRDTIADKLVPWLMKERTHRTDTGTAVSYDIYSWSAGVVKNEGWTRCHRIPVFAKAADSGHPQIAVEGKYLTKEMNYPSSRKLARDVRNSGLMDVENNVIRAGGAQRRNAKRVWIFTDLLLNEVCTYD